MDTHVDMTPEDFDEMIAERDALEDYNRERYYEKRLDPRDLDYWIEDEP